MPSPSARAAALALALAAGCAAAPPPPRARLQLDRAPAALPNITVDGAALDARALASAAAFLFPEQTRALVRELLRAEFARREGQRLALEPDAATLEDSLARALAGIQATMLADEDLEAWALRVYGRSTAEVTAALRDQLAENQLYQLVLRADARAHGRARVAMLVTTERERAETWARQLALGADPARMAAESLERAPGGGPVVAPLALYLPPPLGEQMARARAGDVLGPAQLAGDSAWRVLRVIEVLPPERTPPPVSVLLAELAAQPVGPLEARAWFEEMCRRYTAADRLPSLQAPGPAFLPLEPR
ncbi:MAG: peptidyl-prolyl cis-trans isomerase [Planctomycetota bacterium]|nr:MAG: peptidyl-prolyl cis-trans isomerase [Planctomycetota bacterium]